MTAPRDDSVLSNSGDLVVDAVERILKLAATWLAWDGRPSVGEGGDRIYTPNKAIRRHADHLIDHLAEIECLLAGVEPIPDRWQASVVTFASDWAHFTEVELNEATERLRRLARTFALRLAALEPEEWDRSREPSWTVRAITEHVARSWYAEQVGDLTTLR